jgi:hypothetical protein
MQARVAHVLLFIGIYDNGQCIIGCVRWAVPIVVCMPYFNVCMLVSMLPSSGMHWFVSGKLCILDTAPGCEGLVEHAVMCSQTLE